MHASLIALIGQRNGRVFARLLAGPLPRNAGGLRRAPPQRFICPPERRLERARERNMGCVVCGSPCMHVVRARNGVLVTLTHAGSIYHVRLLWGE